MRDAKIWDLFYSNVIDPTTTEGAIAYGITILLIAVIAAKLVRVWTRRLHSHPHLFIDPTVASFLGQLMQLACFLFAATFYAHLVPSLSRLGTALLASASIVSLVIGLAAQNTLGNLIAGVALLLYRPFEIEDVLVVNTPTGRETGKVEDFTLGYTKLLTEDGRRIVVPNSVMISNVFIRLGGGKKT